MILVMATAFLLAAGSSVAAKPDSGERIDKACGGSMDKAMTTVAQHACIDAACKAWDRLFNRNYKADRARLDKSDRQLLRTARRKVAGLS